MFIRRYFQNENGTRRAYWALVESYRTDSGPRQRIVAWLGKLDAAGQLGVDQAACDASERPETHSADQHGRRQLALFDQPQDEDTSVQPQWVEVNAAAVRVENDVKFGGPWLALEIVRRLQLDQLLRGIIATGREHVAWWRSVGFSRLDRSRIRWNSVPERCPNSHKSRYQQTHIY